MPKKHTCGAAPVANALITRAVFRETKCGSCGKDNANSFLLLKHLRKEHKEPAHAAWLDAHPEIAFIVFSITSRRAKTVLPVHSEFCAPRERPLPLLPHGISDPMLQRAVTKTAGVHEDPELGAVRVVQECQIPSPSSAPLACSPPLVRPPALGPIASVLDKVPGTVEVITPGLGGPQPNAATEPVSRLYVLDQNDDGSVDIDAEAHSSTRVRMAEESGDVGERPLEVNTELIHTKRRDVTGYTPNQLFLGRENRAPLDIVIGIPPNGEQQFVSTDCYVAEYQEKSRKAYETVRQHLKHAAEIRKQRYDVRVRPTQFSVGDWVWYYYPRRYVGKSPKWMRVYIGPYLITRVIAPSTAVIQRSRRAKAIVVHFDKLKRCFGTTPRSWLPSNPDVTPMGTDLAANHEPECEYPRSSPSGVDAVTGDKEVKASPKAIEVIHPRKPPPRVRFKDGESCEVLDSNVSTCVHDVSRPKRTPKVPQHLGDYVRQVKNHADSMAPSYVMCMCGAHGRSQWETTSTTAARATHGSDMY